MNFSSVEFFAFFICLFACYQLLPWRSARSALLLAASLFFYAWAGLFDLAIFLFVIAVSFCAAYFAGKWPSLKKLFISTGICVLVAHLILWKYSPWILGNLQMIFPGLHAGRPLYLHLPLGISFFTFTGIAFLVDYSRGKTAMMTFREYLLFHSFFSNLIAGPIVRADQLAPALGRLESPSAEDMGVGLMLIARGFFKKMVIADRLAPFVDIVFASPGQFNRHTLIWALAGFLVQVWADFSGYTDMGRGTARMLGIRLPENFLSPLLSRKPSEFWDRWHITLTRWMRDYVWAPIAGSPLSALITSLLIGLWHGSNWTFLVWGLYWRVLVIIERSIERSGLGRVWERSVPESVRHVLLVPTAFALASFGSIFFRCPDMSSCMTFLHGLLQGPLDTASVLSPGQAFHQNIYPSFLMAFLLEAIFYRSLLDGRFSLLEWLRTRGYADWIEGVFARPWAGRALGFACGVLIAAVVAASIALRQYDNFAPFIYFQF